MFDLLVSKAYVGFMSHAPIQEMLGVVHEHPHLMKSFQILGDLMDDDTQRAGNFALSKVLKIVGWVSVVLGALVFAVSLWKKNVKGLSWAAAFLFFGGMCLVATYTGFLNKVKGYGDLFNQNI